MIVFIKLESLLKEGCIGSNVRINTFVRFLQKGYFTPRVSLLISTDQPYCSHALGQHFTFVLLFSVRISSIFAVIREQKTK